MRIAVWTLFRFLFWITFSSVATESSEGSGRSELQDIMMYTNKGRGPVGGSVGGGGGGVGSVGGGTDRGGRISMTSKMTLSREDSTLAQLCDLHVYKVPSDLWRDSFNNILNNVVTETVSVGIIRVPMELRLADVREELVQQLQLDDIRDYVFLRSVGRSLTRLRGKQEYQLKAKHFLPPVAYAPELYILEATPELRDAMSERMSQSPPFSRRTSPTHTHRGYNNSYRNGYTEKGRDRRHDDDSGVAGLTPEDEFNRRNRDEYEDQLRKNRDMARRLEADQLAFDDEAEAERRRRLGDLEAGNEMDRRRWDADQEERRKQAEIDRRKQEEDEEERRRREEQDGRLEDERRAKEEENEIFRKEEEERRRREEEEESRRRKQLEEDEQQRNRLEDSNRFGSPPPRASSPNSSRDTESARQRRRDEKNQLLKDIEEARQNRQDQEKEREDLVKKAKSMQHKTTNRRNEARDMWKKKYFEEKKKTAPLEDSSSRLRQELEALHRRLMNTLEGPREKKSQVTGLQTIN